MKYKQQKQTKNFFEYDAEHWAVKSDFKKFTFKYNSRKKLLCAKTTKKIKFKIYN